MFIDRHCENVASRLIDDAETVSLSSHDVLNEERDRGATLESTDTIERSGVRDGNNPSSHISSKERERRIVPPITCFKVNRIPSKIYGSSYQLAKSNCLRVVSISVVI